MAIEETCPSCGGHRFTMISPGLVECTSDVEYTVMVEVEETVMVDDPGVFHNLGLRGMRPQIITRMIEETRTKPCTHRYDIEAPMTTIACQSGPGGTTCGAFAVGMCAECSRPVCRLHGTYVDDRLLCASCHDEKKTKEAAERAVRQAEQRAADERRRIADAERAEAARAAKEADVAAEAARIAALPKATAADLADFLRGNDEALRAKQFGTWDVASVAGAFALSGMPGHKVHVGTKRVLGVSRQHFMRGWVVAETTIQVWNIDAYSPEKRWVVLCEDGHLRRASPWKHYLSAGIVGDTQWAASPHALRTARYYFGKPVR